MPPMPSNSMSGLDPDTVAMMADLGISTRSRVFEEGQGKEKKHRSGLGEGLFDQKSFEEGVGEWHSFQGRDTMRDLAAEALGDINMGQTHRLNRMAIGGSAQASGQYRQFASDDSLVAGYFDRQRPLPPPGPGRRAISPTMQRSGGQLPPLPAIMPGQRGVPTLQGGNMDIARQLQASFPKGGKSKGPRFSSHEAEYPLPARLLAPRMPGPRGAKQARQVSQPMMGRYPVQSPLPPRPAPRPVTQAPVRSLSKGKKKKDRSVSGSDSELAKTPLPVKKFVMPVLAETIPAGPGLSSSRYAPAKYQPKATSTKSSAASASTSAVASPKPVNGLPAVVEEELHASKGMMEGWIETIYIAKDNVLAGTPLTASKNGHLAVERAKSVAGRKDSVVAVTAPTTPTVEKKLVGYIDSSSPPATPEPQTPTQEHFIDLTVVDNGASKDARFFTPASGDDTEFATIDDDYTAVMDNYSGDFVDDFDFDDDEVIAMPKKKVGKEGIMADGTVYGGPYFLAAIIAAAPYIGNPSLDM